MAKAKVAAKLLGSPVRDVEADTVREARAALALDGNYAAAVNGTPASDDQRLSDNQIVTFSAAVKGNSR